MADHVHYLYARDENRIPWGAIAIRYPDSRAADYAAGELVSVEFSWSICHPDDRFSKPDARVRLVERMNKHRPYSGYVQFSKSQCVFTGGEKLSLPQDSRDFASIAMFFTLFHAARNIRACAQSSRSFKLARFAREQAQVYYDLMWHWKEEKPKPETAAAQ